MASIRKRTWTSGGEIRTAWIADYFDQSGKRHIKTFKTKKAAQDYLDETKIEVKRGIQTAPRASNTVAAAGEAWIAQAKADGLEASTVWPYRQHLGRHIIPFLGAVKLSDLTQSSIKGFRNALMAAGPDRRSRVMAKKVVSSLGSILADAMGAGKVAQNVVRQFAQQDRHRVGSVGWTSVTRLRSR